MISVDFEYDDMSKTHPKTQTDIFTVVKGVSAWTESSADQLNGFWFSKRAGAIKSRRALRVQKTSTEQVLTIGNLTKP